MTKAILLMMSILFFYSCSNNNSINYKGNIHFQFINIGIYSEEYSEYLKNMSEDEFLQLIKSDIVEISKINNDFKVNINEIDTIFDALKNISSIIVIDNVNNKKIRIIVPEKIKDQVWNINPHDLTEKGETLFIDLEAVRYKDVLILKKVNKMKYIEGRVSLSK